MLILLKNDNLAIPIIVLVVMFISAFVPLLPILLMYGNSGLFYLLSVGTENAWRLINLILTIVSLFFLYKAKSTSAKALSSLFLVFFILPVTRYITETILGHNFESAQLFIDSFVISAPLFIIGLIKIRQLEKMHFD